jgi:hypothetical protein
MTRCVLAIFFALSLGTLLAHAGPVIEISEPPCTSTDTLVTSLNNGFQFSPINGGGVFGFCNETDTNWTRLLLAISTSVTDTVTCIPGAFLSCASFTDPNHPGFIYVFFDGVSAGLPPFVPPHPGVPDGSRFEVNLDCQNVRGCTPVPDGTGAWTGDTIGFGYANFDPNDPLPTPSPVPEPATLGLVSAGVAVGFFRRKRLN